MKRIISCFFLALLFLSLITPSMAGVVVVVNKDNPISQIGAKDLQKIFMGKTKSFPEGGKAIPVNLKNPNSTKTVFYESIIKISMSSLTSYWSKMIFTGKKTPPKAFDSEQEILKFVTENPQAIAYIDSSLVTDDVKVIYRY